VVRADREDTLEISSEIEERVFGRLVSELGNIQAVIISDYGKGVITESLLEKVITTCKEKGVFVGVDPKESHFFNYKKASVVTPNHHEAGFVAGHRIRNDNDLKIVGKMLLGKLEADSVLITRGDKGMTLFSSDGEVNHFPTVAQKVFDVTGAGDTVIAVFVAAVAAGANLKEAAVISNSAAGLVVGQIGTATVTVEQLKKELRRNSGNGK
jgi:rfaE bifunctional protein kinase chain/domain